jgi:hypothetical protein
MRFHNFRVLSAPRIGVDGLRSHSRGKALRALMGVKLKEPSVGGLAGSLEDATICVSVTTNGCVSQNKGEKNEPLNKRHDRCS